MKWVSSGGCYDFVIELKDDGKYDLDVKYHFGMNSTFWFYTLGAAKQFVRRQYAGLPIEKWKKVEE